MIFYIKTKGLQTEEFLGRNGTFIGTSLNDLRDILTYESLVEHRKKGEFLVCSIQNLNWYIPILFVNKDSIKEIVQKYKDNTKVWFWISKDALQYCTDSFEYKDLINIEF